MLVFDESNGHAPESDSLELRGETDIFPVRVDKLEASIALEPIALLGGANKRQSRFLNAFLQIGEKGIYDFVDTCI